MKRKTVEKPGWRQPAHLRSQIPNLGFCIQFGLMVVLLLGVTGWAQTGDRSSLAQTPVGAPRLVTSRAGYQLHQGDKIEVRFFYQPELNHEAVVKPDGFVTLQLIGDVRAEGLTPRELETMVTGRYAELLVDPVVSVILKEYVRPRVFIGGQVNHPGPYELRDGDTMAQALILAGGFTSRAHRRNVLHARPMGEGQMRVTVVDATRLYTRNPDPDLNLTLQEGDLIFVPDSKLSRINDVVSALHLHSLVFFLNTFR